MPVDLILILIKDIIEELAKMINLELVKYNVLNWLIIGSVLI